MIDWIVQILESVPRELATIILATLPITELRLAIPIAMHVWLLEPLDALGYAIFGNMLPLFPLYFGLERLRGITVKHAPWITRFIDSQILRAHKKVEKKYAKYGALALCLFTALPLPFTGLWTATLAAIALKIPFKYTVWGIVPGVFIAGILVTLLSVSKDVLF